MKANQDENIKNLFRDIELYQPSENFTAEVMQKVYQTSLKSSYKPLLSRKTLFIIYCSYFLFCLLLVILSVEIPGNWNTESLGKNYSLVEFLFSPPAWFYSFISTGTMIMLLDTAIYFFKKDRVTPLKF